MQRMTGNRISNDFSAVEWGDMPFTLSNYPRCSSVCVNFRYNRQSLPMRTF